MNYALILLELIVGGLLLYSAFGLLRRRPALAAQPARRLPRYAAAIVTAFPGIGMIAATVIPLLAFFAAVLSIAVASALAAHRKLRGEATGWLSVAVVILGSAAVGLLQPLGLRVAALPSAERLPYQPVPATVVKTYDAGLGFESVRAGPDGTLYLAGNRDLEFADSVYFRRARGQVIARRRDGTEQVIFSTPAGTTAGPMAIAPDGTIYMTSNGRDPAIWRIDRNSFAQRIAVLPTGAWPNGIDFGPDGKLYAADSNLAQVWRIDPASGRFEVALRDPQLAARRFVALAPGANGLHFAGNEMIVTVSDRATVLAYKLAADGGLSFAKVLARGIPGDDFAIGRDGSLFITTHPYDTLVRLRPDGRRTIVANGRQHIVGATDATFGRGTDDRDTLYVATDGGAFTAGPKARGELVAVRPWK